MGKQFVTSDVQTTHDGNRLPSVDQAHLRSDEGIVEVRVAARDPSGPRRAACGRHIADVGKAFRAQQFVGDIQGRKADVVGNGKSNGGRFRRCLLGERIRETHETCGTR